MARNLTPRSKIARRIGEKLQLKGERDAGAKNAFTRRNYPPGVHGPKGYRRLTEYGIQLKEKQKVKALFGVMERQFARYISKAFKIKGETGNKLLELLELRLDNVIYRLHIATSRTQARQMVSHGHILVNNKKVTIPSFELKPGDSIGISGKFKSGSGLKERITSITSLQLVPPEWIEFNYEDLQGKMLRVPSIDECEQGIDTRLIVEFYSK